MPASSCQDLIGRFKHRLLDMVAEEVNKEDMQALIKEKMVAPLLQIVFKEINHYVYGLFILVSLSLLFSLMSLIVLVMLLTTGRAWIFKQSL